VLHLLPYWNWAGKEGQPIRVDVLSNCEEVELLLNGGSLGRQPMKRDSKLTWNVKYAPGTLSAKGFNRGQCVAEAKVESTGEAAAVQLTPNRKAILANGEDLAVFTVALVDAQGRIVPTAHDQLHFELSGAGRILGVGNGDPSCHEPDTFITQLPVKTIPVEGWHWKLGPIPSPGAPALEYAQVCDESSWKALKPKTDGNTGEQVLTPGQTAIFRAHVQLTQADLESAGMLVRFAGIDDHGWFFVNSQPVGESHDWQAQPAFDLKQRLHAGDNVIAVGVRNDAGQGGLNPDVNIELVGKPVAAAWSRSAFNGLAQVLVQATRSAGEIRLTASADGLKPATVSVQAQPANARAFVP
jgi:beta-galactosidase